MENSKKSIRRIRMTKQMIQQSLIELLEKKPIEKSPFVSFATWQTLNEPHFIIITEVNMMF